MVKFLVGIRAKEGFEGEQRSGMDVYSELPCKFEVAAQTKT